MFTEKQLANALRFLSIDAVEAAQSGHPGMPLGMADIATVLWRQFLRHSPANPKWFNRDRFVLSNGHGSMLLYSLLHLSGYKLSMTDLKQFRQLHSKTPGHPEIEETPGVETTTGPLGQGLANAVGMAIAEKTLAARFNRPQHPLVDHFSYAFVGDGCLMEGISHEACSLAGTLALGKLIVFYDDNGISIDGAVKDWFTDDTSARFKAYHWQVIGPVDGHDPQAIAAAITQAQAEHERPSLIICKTVIGYASPAANTAKAHGAPLGAEGVAAVRQALDWPFPPFEIPAAISAAWNALEEGQRREDRWLALCASYQAQYPEDYAEFLRRINQDLPDDWDAFCQQFLRDCQSENRRMATRKASQYCLEKLAGKLPEMLGGSADLTSSNNTNWSGSQALSAQDGSGNYLYYGVREFAMAAMMNGMALHGGVIPYGGTFLVFADYARNAMRLAALMKQRVIYVLTHDSIGLGEDGPTHQPVEHAAMLRITPNMTVWRPADLLETAVAWQQALNRQNGPSALLLSRQELPPLPHAAQAAEAIARGAYIVQDCEGEPAAILIATGSEVALALAVAKANPQCALRVISMPCCELFLAQDMAWQESVLPRAVRKRLVIEAAAPDYWFRFAGLDGEVVGIERFGLSAPAEQIYQELGFGVEHISQRLQDMMER
ncbi:MAG: transketolase [Legionellaceae bacterium]|nr:transketolase [Legionellaceae bacterium]